MEKRMDKDLMYSSIKTDWGTPQYLFDNLNDIFQFDLDAAANIHNHKCKKWLGPGSTIAEDALSVEWTGNIFLNPPYGRKYNRKWITKAHTSSIKNNALVVCLLPARTETRMFDICWQASLICFIRGRLKFELDGNTDAAPFPNCIVVFGEIPEDTDISILAGEGTIIKPIHHFDPSIKEQNKWLEKCRANIEEFKFNNPRPPTLR
jgi:phage N-6-adenine-methyltransferase